MTSTSRFLALALAAGLAGCAATTPDWDESFGDAVRQARAAQVLDPQAPSRNAPALGIDGKAAAGAIKAYDASYGYAVQEPRPSTLQLAPTTGR